MEEESHQKTWGGEPLKGHYKDKETDVEVDEEYTDTEDEGYSDLEDQDIEKPRDKTKRGPNIKYVGTDPNEVEQ